MTIATPIRPFRFAAAARLSALLLLSGTAASLAVAAGPPSRLRADAAQSTRADLAQPVSARQAHSQALGSVSGDTALESMSLVLAPSAAQSAALDQLLADQQNPASPRYHQWLTPAQFGAQFGVSDADLQLLRNWLTSQGLQVQGVAPSRNAIYFSGTAGTVEAAFHPALGRFRHNGRDYIGNAHAPSMPAAFTGVVAGIRGLSTWHPQPHGRLQPMTQQLHSDYTTTNSQGAVVHELVPYDVRQIYSAASLVSSGYTGTGITIGVIGQSAVSTAQLGFFQSLTGQTVNPPNMVLVPGTGVSTLYAGDEFESEADLEFAGGVAPGATINFIYTGSSTNADVITALEYAITNNSAQILTLSYGLCELYAQSEAVTLEPYLRQASVQGQTFLNSSGDSGAAGCDGGTATAYYGLAVSYPASSPNVTAVGGTTLNDANGTYWSATNNSQNGSALSYIPEVVWNDTDSTGQASSGGGTSTLFGKPAWQAGTGVPADGARDVPDIAFAAGSGHDPYFICSADTSATYTTSGGSVRTAACTSSSGGYFAVGGTSLSTPSFAAMLALMEQSNGGKRMGNINPALYRLAGSSPASFNDITGGTNAVPCLAGSPGCVNGTVGYAATTGYDRATGLGSLNISTVTPLLAPASTATATTPTVSIQSIGTNTVQDTFLISVAPVNGTAFPTGTVSVSVDGGTSSSLTLVNGNNTYSVSVAGLASGSHTLTATYAGNGTYSSATATFTFTTGNLTGTFALSVSPTALSISNGSSGSATVTLTSTGYSGLVEYTVAPASGSATAPGCFTGVSGDYTDSNSNVALSNSIAAGSTTSAAITYHAVTNGCASLAQSAVPVRADFLGRGKGSGSGSGLPWAAFAFGGFLLGGISLRRRSSLLSSGLLAIAFTFALLGASGCGSGSAPLSTTTTTSPTSGSAVTYTYVVTAVSIPAGGASGIASTTASANLTFTVQ